MPRLTPLRPRAVMEKLRALGYEGPFAGGKYSRMVHRESGKVISIPVHGNRDVSVGLIGAIIREIGISVDEWLDL